MHKYRRIVIFGGASAQWTPENVWKMGSSASCCEAEVVLVDIAVDRAEQMAALCNAMIARRFPGSLLRVSAEPSLEAALPGAEVVFTCYCNLGLQIEEKLNALTARYGSHQGCFTAGPGAVLYVATQAPPMIALAHAMRQYCPQAWLINCSNPLPAMGMVASLAGVSARRVLGFCGALSWTREIVARFLDVAPERLDFRIGGTNHCTFLTEVWLDGRDAYPLLRERARTLGALDLGCWGKTTMEINLLAAIGYLCPGGHPSDIFPTVSGQWIPPGEDAPPRPPNFLPNFREALAAYIRGDGPQPGMPEGREVPIAWLDALAGDPTEQRFSINYINDGVVSNMPPWAVLDLECQLDPRGVSPLAGPPLPEVIAEVARRHQVSFELAARAAVTRDHDLLVQAIQLAPFSDFVTRATEYVAEARAEFGEELIF